MNNELAKEPEFSEKFEELMQRVKNRDVTKKMSDKELLDLRRTIDDEVIRRKVVQHIYELANRLK